MDWIHCLGNAKPIESVYSVPPSLSNVRLHEIRFHQDGPRISLRFDLNEFPDQPPKKWVGGQFNRAQLTLVLIDIIDANISGWKLNNVGSIDLSKNEEEVRLTFEGEKQSVDLKARFVEVEKLSGYRDSETAIT